MTYPFTPEQEAWLRDLETTEEPQATGSLHIIEPGPGESSGFCCLGRACVSLGLEETPEGGHFIFNGQSDDTIMPDGAWELLRLRGSGGELDRPAELGNGRPCVQSLYRMNDIGMTFKEIAAYIRANPENVFLPLEEEA